MDPEVSAALIGGGAGLATGVVGSIFAPWSNWGVEKRRLRHERRAGYIDNWREELSLAEYHGTSFTKDAWYRTMLAQSSPSAIDRIRRRLPKRWFKPQRRFPDPRSHRTVVVTPDGGQRGGEVVEAEAEINRLARKWGID